ncbi:MAG: glycoside hydrolase family 57 protein [Candidatus Diapherotrites archaeon]|nr:glycoside hydrolase family 57 protein [Candidatus Diapherotrites archaeon]
MTSVCFYFQVHQPNRLRHYSFLDIGNSHNYFDDDANKFYLERVSRKCYIPANEKILDLIHKTDGQFKVAYSITGVFLELLEKEFPHVLQTFVDLVDTGCVEILNETYYHSLAYLVSKDEFKNQVKMQEKKIKSVFGVTPKVFRNTESMFSNEIAATVEQMGYKGIICEGLDNILTWRSPNFLYYCRGCSDMKVLLRNYRLSDDIGFRFSTPGWSEAPLTADKYALWLASSPGQTVNLFLDYETFGEHQWPETGIFEFLSHLPSEVLKNEHMEFNTPSELLKKYEAIGEFDVPYFASWADVDRDLSAWLENDMQKEAFERIKSLESKINQLGDKTILDDWRKLQTSDNFYYMCTKWFADGDIHKYFNHYDSPYDAFINYMNVLSDVEQRLAQKNDAHQIGELKTEV